MVKTQVNIGRISPMLRSVIKNEAYIPKQTILSQREKSLLAKSPSSVVSDKPNREELPEIRARKIKQILEQTMRRKSIKMQSLSSKKGMVDDETKSDVRVSQFLAPIESIINKRKRFTNVDHSIGEVDSPEVK